MAIDNPQAVRFCNEKLRVAANKLAQAFAFARAVKEEWDALGMGNLITAGGGEVVDGSAVDGRPPITGNSVIGIMYRIDELTTDYKANNNAKLNSVLAVAPNPQG